MDADDLSEWLDSWRNFQECILRDVRSTDGMCTVDVSLEYIWKDRDGDDWNVAGDSDPDWPLLTVRLRGVANIQYSSDIWRRQDESPLEIGPGFAEISLARARPCNDGIEFTIAWERGRELVVVAASAEVE